MANVGRTGVVRDAVGVGLATGALGLSFGALAVAAGLSVWQACALSLLMFTGASQFAFVGLVGGGAAAAVATALLLGTRNALYGLRLAPLLDGRRPLAAHLVIDESTAMAVGRETPAAARLGFFATGAAVFTCWNVATLIGAAAGSALSDPRTFGLDAAAPAAFLALLAPRVVGARGARADEVAAGAAGRDGDAARLTVAPTGEAAAPVVSPLAVALLAGAAALVAVPLVPAGVPVLVAAVVAVVMAR